MRHPPRKRQLFFHPSLLLLWLTVLWVLFLVVVVVFIFLIPLLFLFIVIAVLTRIGVHKIIVVLTVVLFSVLFVVVVVYSSPIDTSLPLLNRPCITRPFRENIGGQGVGRRDETVMIGIQRGSSSYPQPKRKPPIWSGDKRKHIHGDLFYEFRIEEQSMGIDGHIYWWIRMDVNYCTLHE